MFEPQNSWAEFSYVSDLARKWALRHVPRVDLLVCLSVLFTSAEVAAAPITWIRASNQIGAWSDPTAWSPATVPDGSTDIVIGAGGVSGDTSFTNQYQLDIGTAAHLFLQPTTIITNTGVIELSGSIGGSGTLVNSGGTIIAESNGALIGVDVTQTTYGVLQAHSGATLALDGMTVTGGLLEGTIETLNGVTADSVILSGSGTSTTLTAGSNLTVEGASNNLGALRLEDGAQLSGTGQIANQGGSIQGGSIFADAGRSVVGVDVTQNTYGVLQARSGATLALDGMTVTGGRLEGTIETLNGVTADSVILSGSGGSTTLTSSSILTTVGSSSVAGAFEDAGALVNLGSTSNTGRFDVLNDATLSNTGNFGNIASGALLIGSGGRLINTGNLANLAGGGLVVGSGGELTNTGAIMTDYLSGLAMQAGSRVENSGVMTFAGNPVVLGGVMVDNGAVNLQSGPPVGDPPIAMPIPPLTIASTGTLRGLGSVLGDVINDGLLSPGDPLGTFTVYGSYTQSGELDILLDGTGLSEFGLLDVTGLASLGGALDFIAYDGFAPKIGDMFEFMSFGESINDFASVTFTNWTCPIDAFCSQIRTDHSMTLAILGGPPPTNVPEPDTLELVEFGLLGLAAARWRRAA